MPALAVALALSLTGCASLAGARLGGERRLVSLRERELDAGALQGTLAYVEARGVRQTAVYVHDLGDDERERLASVPEGMANSPAWSPDGRRLALSVATGDVHSRLYVVDVPRDQAQPVTSGPVFDDYPRWSPDGEELVFSSIREGSHDWRLYRMPADGAAARRIATPRGHSVFPDWSPDGRWVVYAHRPIWGRNYKLRLHDLRTGADRAITDGPGDDLYPRFSAGGRRVLFSSSRDEVWQIQTLELATGETERPLGSDSMDEFPAWSPDGRHIAFSAGHLAIYRADGGELASGVLRWQVTRNLAWAPDWRPQP